MGKKSIKEDKNIFQLCREECNLTRAAASELMVSVTEDKIKKIENGTIPTDYDVLQMAEAYNKPELCNWHCTHTCKIGQKYIPQVEISELPSIVLETVATLNEIQPLINRLIQITKDGKISDDEIPDFALISKKLNEVSLASDALNLWVEKTMKDNDLNVQLLMEEKEKLSQ